MVTNINELLLNYRYIYQHIHNHLFFWIDDKKVDTFLSNKNIFFILSIGRSGTKFLSDLLNMAPKTIVVHEPFPEYLPYQDAFKNQNNAYDYIKNFRKKNIFLRINKISFENYGEVNSFLRRHCIALKKEIPNVHLIHLVRDGRECVRSMMSRNTMKSWDIDTKRIFPEEDDPWINEWFQMSRFERICWYWQNENQFLRQNINNHVQFEKIISDYKYLEKNILNPLNIKLSEDIWAKSVNIPKNVTKKYEIPHWDEWDKGKIRAFENICGKEMKENGYTY